MIKITLNDAQVAKALDKLHGKADNLSPVLKSIGEELVLSTKQRFQTATDPDGNAWARNGEVAIERKGRNQPLWDHGDLGSNIGPQLLNPSTLVVGSNAEQAAMMQFGGTKAEFPNLWSDIPARPFLGLSNADKDMILEELVNYFDSL
jgi:phage virion morphogenesis protein